MAKTAIGRRVKYVGSVPYYKGLFGTIIDKASDSYRVRWDGSGGTQWHGFSALLVLWDDAEPAVEAAQLDPVNQPQHYASGEIECIDAIRASMTKEAFCGYLKGCAQKYFWRYEKKINPVEDIKKARWYSERLIKELEDA
ncbi:hypothetical protein [Enterobacter phage SDFMU_Pec]|uniref:DUF3310 domain-containing protein n=1 Tax=Enterobacter phage SDFMU_Pec TaxID=3076136 RepID=A0AA96KRI8_9CAUD|nr:hypothetical protein [Enterobacter phage SDFMU_Pec]